MYIGTFGELGRGSNDCQIQFHFTTPVASCERAHINSNIHLVDKMRKHIRNSGRLGSTRSRCVCAEYSNPLRGGCIAGVYYYWARGDGGGSMLDVMGAIMLPLML